MLPSELSFFSFLLYFKQGKEAGLSRALMYAIKTDGHILAKRPEGVLSARGIDEIVLRMKTRLEEFPFLKECFGEDVCLIPMPRSSLLVDKNALWPSMRICQELQKQKLSGSILPIVERTKAIQKAALAEPGKRPTPLDHYESTRVKNADSIPERITLVDDFVTRGSTFIGIYPHVREVFPKASIQCFGLMRTATESGEHQAIEPVQGTITFSYYRSGEPCLARKP